MAIKRKSYTLIIQTCSYCFISLIAHATPSPSLDGASSFVEPIIFPACLKSMKAPNRRAMMISTITMKNRKYFKYFA